MRDNQMKVYRFIHLSSNLLVRTTGCCLTMLEINIDKPIPNYMLPTLRVCRCGNRYFEIVIS